VSPGNLATTQIALSLVLHVVNKRLDEWVPEDRLQFASIAAPKSSKNGEDKKASATKEKQVRSNALVVNALVFGYASAPVCQLWRTRYSGMYLSPSWLCLVGCLTVAGWEPGRVPATATDLAVLLALGEFIRTLLRLMGFRTRRRTPASARKT